MEISVGLGANTAAQLMSGFFHRILTGVPELVEVSKVVAGVPTGEDALLITSARGTELMTRSGTKESLKQPAHELLRWMGGLGLTSVAIPQDDPLWQTLPIKQTAWS